MIQCRRLAYAVLTTTDIDKQVRYYESVLGLRRAGSIGTRTVLSTAHGVECLVLERGERAELTGLSFEISPRLSLEEAKELLERRGLEARIRPGRTPGVDRVVAFKDPKGTEIELFNAMRFAEGSPSEGGISPLKLGHVAYSMPTIEAISEFYVGTLGFRKSDWREGAAMFLRCSTDHHTVNFFKGEQRLHHLAFEVKDFPELVRASDILVRNNHPLTWGPARHTIGHNCACYHPNPDGLLIELYAEMDQMLDEELGYFDPKPWHEFRPQRPRAWGPHDSPRNKWIPSEP
jgi:catechol 2,3-dioxygenase-like lactoylglutathione lyase family enzyme